MRKFILASVVAAGFVALPAHAEPTTGTDASPAPTAEPSPAASPAGPDADKPRQGKHRTTGAAADTTSATGTTTAPSAAQPATDTGANAAASQKDTAGN